MEYTLTNFRITRQDVPTSRLPSGSVFGYVVCVAASTLVLAGRMASSPDSDRSIDALVGAACDPVEASAYAYVHAASVAVVA